MRRASALGLAVLAGGSLLRPDAIAQRATTGAIRGVVLSTGVRKPIEGARVVLIGTPHVLSTDAGGGFHFIGLPAGRYVIQASAICYTTLSSPVQVREHQTLEIEFEAEAEAVVLPEIAVEERANHGPPDWIRRKSEGRGRYITRAEIEKRNAATVPDVLRMVPGLRIECRGQLVCMVRMARAPRGCNPAYFMDGIPSDPAVVYLTPDTEVEGIEVYAGPSETPPELESVQARCGVVVIWTRTPPPRRPKEKKPKQQPAVDSAKTDSTKADTARTAPPFQR